MTIRFQCGSCSQPIEVDDEWSAKPVACPYCRKTVTAPIESTLGDPSAFQAATPVEIGGLDAPPVPPPVDAATQPTGKNTLAIVSLVLAIAAIAMLMAGSVVASNHEEQFRRFEQVSAEAATLAERVEIMNNLLKTDPDAMAGLVPFTLLFMGWLATNLAAIVCGIISSRRRARRGLAIAALAISFLPILMFV